MSTDFYGKFWALSPDQVARRRQEMLHTLRGLVVGILSGGWSEEHEISLEAAGKVGDVLTSLSISWLPVEAQQLPVYLRERRFDVVYNLLYGELGEGGATRSLIDLFGVPCTYSRPDASAIALDKWRTKLLAQAYGVPTTWSVFVTEENLDQSLPEIARRQQWPIMCKPNTQGCSIGIEMIRETDDLRSGLERIVSAFGPCLVEPFLPGREFSVGVLETEREGLRAFPVIELMPPENSFMDMETKYNPPPASAQCPANIDAHRASMLAQYALTIHRAVGCFPVSRIDFREDENSIPRLMEVNHHPGMTRHSWLPITASHGGLPYEDLVLEILVAALRDKKPPRLISPLRTVDDAALREQAQTLIVVPGTSLERFRVSVEAAQFLHSSMPKFSVILDFDTFFSYALETGLQDKYVVDCLYGTEEIEWDEAIWRGAMDALGLKRVGPPLITCALTFDKLTQKSIFNSIEVPTAAWSLCSEVSETSGPGWPMIVKPRRDSQSKGVTLLLAQPEWERFLQRVPVEDRDHWFAERYLPGREFSVGLLSVDQSHHEVLPILEIPHDAGPSINDPEDKAVRRGLAEFPAGLPADLRLALETYSLKIHRAFGSPPLARAEWRLDTDGAPHVLEYDCTPALTRTSYITRMIEKTGRRLSDVLVELARPPQFRACMTVM